MAILKELNIIIKVIEYSQIFFGNFKKFKTKWFTNNTKKTIINCAHSIPNANSNNGWYWFMSKTIFEKYLPNPNPWISPKKKVKKESKKNKLFLLLLFWFLKKTEKQVKIIVIGIKNSIHDSDNLSMFL